MEPQTVCLRVDQTDAQALRNERTYEIPPNKMEIKDHDLEVPKSKRVIGGIKMKRENIPDEVRKQNIKNLREGLKKAAEKRQEICEKLASKSKVKKPLKYQRENEKDQEPESRQELENWWKSPAQPTISIEIRKPTGRMRKNNPSTKS